jgi:heptosyltransferase-2
VIGGEADTAVLEHLRGAWANLATTYVVDQPLTAVAAVIARCDVFIGHDSGISHVAAAVGARSVLLFGPTDPEVWAPRGSHVRVIRAASGTMTELKMDDVIDAIRARATATPATQSS